MTELQNNTSLPQDEWTHDNNLPTSNPWIRRIVWLVGGFNLGFVIPMVLLLAIIPIIAPELQLQRPANDVASLPQPTLEPQIAYIVVTSDVASTPTPTQMPSNTPEIVEEVAIAATATDVPPPTNTPFPTATSIPPTATPLPAPPAYTLDGVEFVLQGWNNCGPANVTMALSYYGWDIEQREAAAYLKPEREDKNVTPEEMVSFVTNNTDLSAIYRVNGTADQLRWLIANQFTVIVEAGYEPPGEDWYGHYLTSVGYTMEPDEFTFYDSNLGRASSPSVTIPANDFDAQWQAFNRTYIVVYPPQREIELQTFLGRDWNTTANWRGAADVARQEAADDPNNAFAWFNLGTALTMTGDYGTAARAFDQARTIGLPWRMLWYQFAPYEAYYQTSRLDDVLALAEATLRTTPYVEETYYYMGRVYETRGELTKAQEQYELALRYNENFETAEAALSRVNS